LCPIIPDDNPGFSVEKIKTNMALRVIKNGPITLKDCRMGRLQTAGVQWSNQTVIEDPSAVAVDIKRIG
jgi:alkylation response protein AidB-like acyl-CoA dehydrogenase